MSIQKKKSGRLPIKLNSGGTSYLSVLFDTKTKLFKNKNMYEQQTVAEMAGWPPHIHVSQSLVQKGYQVRSYMGPVISLCQ